MHDNLSNPTLGQLQTTPSLGQNEFSGFQSAPAQPAQPQDTEKKLINLDNLSLGQPKQETNTGRPFFY
jgi:hypothetical protein